jgi:hypothetical protein
MNFEASLRAREAVDGELAEKLDLESECLVLSNYSGTFCEARNTSEAIDINHVMGR